MSDPQAGAVPEGITALRNWLESEDFDRLMYRYRSAPFHSPGEVNAALFAVRQAIIEKASEVVAARSVVAPRGVRLPQQEKDKDDHTRVDRSC